MVPAGKGDTVVMEGGVAGAFTVRLNPLELLPAELVAVTVKLETPAAVGVPLRTPVDEPRLNPAGSVPLATVQVMGAVPLAARVWE